MTLNDAVHEVSTAYSGFGDTLLYALLVGVAIGVGVLLVRRRGGKR